MRKYFKYRWNETSGDKFDDWGFSTWYNEFDEDFYASRQLVIYDSGNILKYDEKHLDDEFGCLAEKSLSLAELEESEFIEISQDEFENIWTSHQALNE